MLAGGKTKTLSLFGGYFIATMLVVTEFARVSGKMGAQFRFFGVGKMSLHDTDIANSWAGKWDKRVSK